jgi:hypothetical protein
MKSLTVLLGMVAVAIAGETFAITNGDLDGEAHPYVGLMIGKNAQGRMAQRCSGTLMSPTLFLVAGHCTAPPVASVEIWFQSDVQSGIPGNGIRSLDSTAGHLIRILSMAKVDFSATTLASSY